MRDSGQLDRVTLLYLESLAREHIDKYDGITTVADMDAWCDRGEAICDAVDAFRAIVKPDPIAAQLRRGLRR